MIKNDEMIIPRLNDQNNVLDTQALAEQVRAGSVESVRAQGVAAGFVLAVSADGAERYLVAQRGHVRVFRKLDSLAGFLKEMGVDKPIVVDLTGWAPDA